MYGLYSRAASNQEWPMMARVRHIKTARPYVTKLLLNFGTSNSFQAGLDRNQVYRICCSGQTANQPVKTSSAKQTTGTKSLLSSIQGLLFPYRDESQNCGPLFCLVVVPTSLQLVLFSYLTVFCLFSFIICIQNPDWNENP